MTHSYLNLNLIQHFHFISFLRSLLTSHFTLIYYFMQKSRSGLGVSLRERSLVCDFLTHHRVHHLQFPLYLPYPLSHNTGGNDGFPQYTIHLRGVCVISSGFIPHYLPYPLSHNTGGNDGFPQYTIHLCLLVPINIIN